MSKVKIFAENVAEQIKKYLPEHLQEGKLRVMEVIKNNDTCLIGLSFYTSENVVIPVIYMESFYYRVQQGESMEEVIKSIAECLEQSAQVKELPQLSTMADYKSIEDYLMVVIVNTTTNRKMLSEMPHYEIEDLSIICEVSIPLVECEMSGSFKVTNDLLSKWGVTKEEVFEKAKKNTIQNLQPELYSMDSLIGFSENQDNLLQEGKELSTNDFPMYILTNSKKRYGAVALIFPQILERIEQLFSEGYYLLPSSIHELIVVPKNENMIPQELGRLVREANREDVLSEEVLSDRIYEYDKEAGKVCQVLESIEKTREWER